MTADGHASAVDGSIDCTIVRAPDHGLILQAVGLHRRSVDRSFITSLGEPFLHALYAALLRRGNAFLVAALEGERLHGFILASSDTTRMLSVLMSSPLRLVWAVLSATVRRPAILMRIVETLSYGRKTSGVHAELIVIAVESQSRSRGIGRRLLTKLDEEFVSRGVRTYKVTVHATMTDANRFYVQNGFHLASAFQLYGLSWNLYVRALDDHAGQGSAVAVGGGESGR